MGIVVRTGASGSYLVQTEDGLWDCRLRGRLKAHPQRLSVTSVCIGDRVVLDRRGGTAAISEILPRRSTLSRLAVQPVRHEKGLIKYHRDTLLPHDVPQLFGARTEQVLAANIDLVVVVVAAVAPPLKITTVDRYLLLARQAGIPALVCINKVDQAGIDLSGECAGSPEVSGQRAHLIDVKSSLEKREVGVYMASAWSGQGISALKKVLVGKTSVFAGPSGVGKTSILKSILPDLEAKTLEVNAVTGKGRHSTTFSSLIDIGGGYVADIPGLRSIGFWDLQEETVRSEFDDVEEIAGSCRFSNCTHTHEPGCAVRAAVDTGTLSAARLEEYLRIMRETVDRHGRLKSL